MSFQTESVKCGDTVATIHTTMGDIKVKLFPQRAPKAVENFVTHAKSGYYDGIIFHRVIKDFMIQGGDPTATGMGGESIWGKSFEDEFDVKLPEEEVEKLKTVGDIVKYIEEHQDK